MSSSSGPWSQRADLPEERAAAAGTREVQAMAGDRDGYGPRRGQTNIHRLLEDARTSSPRGVRR